MFISFANFYQGFIQNFSKITALLISLLKITRLFIKLDLKAFGADNNKIIINNIGRINETIVNLSKNNKS